MEYVLYYIVSFVWFPYHVLGSEPTGNRSGSGLAKLELGIYLVTIQRRSGNASSNMTELLVDVDRVAACTDVWPIYLSVCVIAPRWDNQTTHSMTHLSNCLPVGLMTTRGNCESLACHSGLEMKLRDYSGLKTPTR